ncbi:MAG: ribosome small subunit-dependent GTPase A [Spirochaetes bacterium]|nr:ribosome small subunit-dependent GTPase A [Spirochaetota bacterium]
MTGIVLKGYGLYYDVVVNGNRLRCTLKGKLRTRRDLQKFSNPVAVGDVVKVEIGPNGNGVIVDLEKRKNTFSRKEKGKNSREDIIAANIDLVIIIQSFYKPRLNLRFVDRLMVRAKMDAIPVLLCFNKIDLANKADERYVRDYYAHSQADIVCTSAVTGQGLDVFKAFVCNKIALLVGYSGSGKTSILNALFPEIKLRVSEISEKTGKGKHTTTNVEMIEPQVGYRLIDTPGVREFGILDLHPNELEAFFPDFSDARKKCTFKPCTHEHEPNCHVQKMVEKGAIHPDRYLSYLYLLSSLKEYYSRMYT